MDIFHSAPAQASIGPEHPENCLLLLLCLLAHPPPPPLDAHVHVPEDEARGTDQVEEDLANDVGAAATGHLQAQAKSV